MERKKTKRVTIPNTLTENEDLHKNRKAWQQKYTKNLKRQCLYTREQIRHVIKNCNLSMSGCTCSVVHETN